MKKLFLLVVLTITIITFVFLFYSSDMNRINKKFLRSFGISVKPDPISFEEFTIPAEFDAVYRDYNLIQAKAGFDLYEHKGKRAIRYTYEITNFSKNAEAPIYADVICVDSTPVGGDIMCPALDGFILPLNAFSDYEMLNIQYHMPAKKDAPIP